MNKMIVQQLQKLLSEECQLVIGFDQSNKQAKLAAICRTLVGASHNEQLAINLINSFPWNSATEESYTQQSIIEFGYMASSFLSHPDLFTSLDYATKHQIRHAMERALAHTPHINNWILQYALILLFLEDKTADAYSDAALQLYSSWYLGDGVYGDGENYHSSYYNSIVIHPALRVILKTKGERKSHTDWSKFRELEEERYYHYAIWLANQVSPEGWFPPTSRSLAYGPGLFYLLGDCIGYTTINPSLKQKMLTVLMSVIFYTEKHPQPVKEVYMNSGSLFARNLPLCCLNCKELDRLFKEPVNNDPIMWIHLGGRQKIKDF